MCAASWMWYSASCAGVAGEGERVRRSLPVADFGKAITSRMLGASHSIAITRSSPRAMPPCGGQPWLEGGEEGEREERGEACAAAAGVSASAHAAASAQ